MCLSLVFIYFMTTKVIVWNGFRWCPGIEIEHRVERIGTPGMFVWTCCTLLAVNYAETAAKLSSY